MSAIRRVATERVTRLAVKSSPYHAAVTLYEAPDTPGPSTTRRRTRVKREDVELNDQEGPGDTLPATTKRKAKAKTVKTATSATTTATKSKSPKKSKVIPQSLDVPHPAPERWKEAYDAIKEMRSRIPAPVDTMGCDQAQWKEQDPKNSRFATLISLMLSSQTKDEVTDAAVAKLRTAVGGSLSVDAVIAADEATISEAISKVGFWRRKTQYIKQAAQRLCDDFDSDVPKTVDELCSLPGVGPKMAFLALQVAWNLNLGIGVDVHVHRITNRLGWHQRPTKNPEETRLNLQSWLPKELHGEINHMLVGFGQTVCLPVGPKCDSCTLSSAGLCPSARTKKSTKRGSRDSASTTSAVESDPRPKIEIEIDNV
ncbi:DNA glycosylase [Pisolithus marmoratus]|nr:DNA glycosylase [Pisolithus marmoratus]